MIYKEEVTVEDFVDKEFSSFVTSRFEERIPGFDGLIDPQRKVLYTAFTVTQKMKSKKGYNVASLANHTKTATAYEKGAMNLEDVVKNQCSTRLPIFIGEGTFATKTRGGSAARYIDVVFPKYIDILFPPIDNDVLLNYQFDENEQKYVEPTTYNPIIPLLLVNGNSQIGVGYSVDVLPRSVRTVINTLIEFTKGNKLNSTNWRIPISIPHFIGKIDRVGAKRDRQWLSKGVYRWDGNTLIITEYKYDQDHYKYVEHLEKLKREGYILSHLNESFDNDIKFTIKCLKKTRDMTDKQIRKLFMLDRSTTEQINYINNNTLYQFTDETTYIKHWYYERLNLVGVRKTWRLNDISHELKLLRSQIFYMYQIIDKKLDISSITMEKLLEFLRSKDEIIVDINPNTKIDKGYEYITVMRITAMTTDNIAKKKKRIKELEDEFKTLESTETTELFRNDLSALSVAVFGK